MSKKLLTPLELKVMNILWKQKKAFVKELKQNWPDEPVPAYNTISTTVRILQDKGFVSHESFGRTHQYYPIVSKLAYQKNLISNILENAFAGSVTGLVSALIDNESIPDQDLDQLQDLIDKKK